MSDDLHPALKLAREARMMGPARAFVIAGPSKLHALCDGDAELYKHAMLEAGMYVEAKTMKPYDSCPHCGWSPK